jgi:hypothetical protein
MTPAALPIDQYYQALSAKSTGGGPSRRIHNEENSVLKAPSAFHKANRPFSFRGDAMAFKG